MLILRELILVNLTGSWSMLIQDYYGVIIIIFFGGGGNFLDYVDCKGGVIFFFGRFLEYVDCKGNVTTLFFLEGLGVC